MSVLVKVISICCNLPGKARVSSIASECHDSAATLEFKLFIRTRVQGDIGSIHVTQSVEKSDVKDKTCFNCEKKGYLA